MRGALQDKIVMKEDIGGLDERSKLPHEVEKLLLGVDLKLLPVLVKSDCTGVRLLHGWYIL